MKTKLLSGPLFLMLLLPAALAAQETTEPSNPRVLSILEKSWTKEFPTATDSLRRNEELMDQTRKEKDVIKRREQSLPNQTTEEKMPAPQKKPLLRPLASDPIYIYKIKVRNNGAKTITRLYWEYQFLNPETQEVMGTREIFSVLKLSPQKSHVIKAFSRRQPTILVSADRLDKKYRDQYIERLIIHRIHYSDGTAWQRPPTQ